MEFLAAILDTSLVRCSFATEILAWGYAFCGTSIVVPSFTVFTVAVKNMTVYFRNEITYVASF
jgi:hypothetical protein